jgi:hypothetical protein
MSRSRHGGSSNDDAGPVGRRPALDGLLALTAPGRCPVGDRRPPRRRLDDERGEALHPPVDRDVINLDAAFGEEFFDISVEQAEAEVPAHRQRHDVGREPEAGERNRSRTATTNHPGMGRPAPNPSTQQCPINCAMSSSRDRSELTLDVAESAAIGLGSAVAFPLLLGAGATGYQHHMSVAHVPFRDTRQP